MIKSLAQYQRVASGAKDLTLFRDLDERASCEQALADLDNRCDATAIDTLLQQDFVHRTDVGALVDVLVAVLAATAVAALVAGSGVTAGH